MSEEGSLPLLFYGDSYRFPDIYRSMGFLAPDPFISLEHGDERIVLASSLEQGRAEKESRATSVRNLDEFGHRELAAQGLDPDEVDAIVVQRFLGQRGLSRVSIPRYFPVGLADRIRERGIELVVATTRSTPWAGSRSTSCPGRSATSRSGGSPTRSPTRLHGSRRSRHERGGSSSARDPSRPRLAAVTP